MAMAQITFASLLQLVHQLGDRGDLDAGLAPAGSSTFSTFRRGVASTPRSAWSSSSGFFFAFMMLGSEA
jgi:hypothetical protein